MGEMFACRVGPFPFGGAVYLGLCGDREIEPVDADTDEEGLRTLAGLAAGSELSCAPELEAAGMPLGFRARPYRAVEARELALAAWAEARAAGYSAAAAPQTAACFLGAATTYYASAMRRDWPGAHLLSIHLVDATTGAESTHEVWIQASRVVLLPNAGDASKLAELSFSGQRLEVRFDAEPAYAVKAIERVWEVPIVPLPARIAGAAGNADWAAAPEALLVELDVILRALVQLDPVQPDGALDTTIEDAHGNPRRVRVRSAGRLF